MRRSAESPEELEHAFRDAFNANFSVVAAYVLRRLPKPEMEEVASDVFATAWAKWAARPPAEELRPWLSGITSNHVANRQRTLRRRAAAEGRLPRPPKSALSEITDTHNEEPPLRALKQLSITDQELLRLLAWEGLDTSEIAAAIGCSEPTARVRVHRARRRFEHALARIKARNETSVDQHIRCDAKGTA